VAAANEPPPLYPALVPLPAEEVRLAARAGWPLAWLYHPGCPAIAWGGG
jgi:hypothetical protein